MVGSLLFLAILPNQMMVNVVPHCAVGFSAFGLVVVLLRGGFVIRCRK